MKKFKFLLSMMLCFLLVFCNFNLVKAASEDTTVEGETNHFVTGESYAAAVSMAGYNVLDHHLYSNFTLTTTKEVTALTPTFNYFVQVFKSDATQIGNVGDYETPTELVGTLATTTKSVTNKDIGLSEDLPLAYRLIITVKSVTTA